MRTPVGLFALLLISVPAAAQRVVILELDGDHGGKLRAQVETALKAADTVEVVPLKKYVEAAARKKLKAPVTMTSAGVARVARSLKIDAAVTGEVGDTFAVRILDSTGQELWSKELKVKKGMLSADFASKLARAITAAAKTAPSAKGGAEGDEGDEVVTPPPKHTEPEATEERPRHPEVSSGQTEMSDDERARRRGEEQVDESAAARPAPEERDSDLESEGKKKRIKVGPKAITAWLAGTSTWRYYCARAGVASCSEYDTLPTKPPGAPVDFKAPVPYAGFNVQVEVFPLAPFVDNAAQGLGLVGSFGMGFSRFNVTVESSGGSAPVKQGAATDRAWTAQLAYRYYFSFDASSKNAGVGYVGLRAGFQGRAFEIDPAAQLPVPGANRTYGLVSLDVAIPIVKFFSIEVSGSYLFNPRPGPDEIAGFGNATDPTGGATGSGFSLEGGFGGEIWGPVGYRVHLRYTPYADQFYGMGNKWTQTDHGAAFESYTSIIWGLTAAF